jgi:hypothetical protein
VTYQHRELAAGRWFTLTFFDQMANVGSEVERAISWRERGDAALSTRALERALELMELTIADTRNRKRLKELTRVREALLDYFYADNQYGSSDKLWRGYFYAFAYAARNRTLKARAALDRDMLSNLLTPTLSSKEERGSGSSSPRSSPQREGGERIPRPSAPQRGAGVPHPNPQGEGE